MDQLVVSRSAHLIQAIQAVSDLRDDAGFSRLWGMLSSQKSSTDTSSSSADYTIIFCPSVMSQKSSRDTSSSSAAAATTSADKGSTAEDDFLSWLPDFGSGASSHYVLLHSNCIVCFAATIFLSLISFCLL